MPEECFDNDRLRHRQVAGGRFALQAPASPEPGPAPDGDHDPHDRSALDLRPGQNGTVRRHSESGDRQVCGRYRGDKRRAPRRAGCRREGVAAGLRQGSGVGVGEKTGG